MWQNCKSELLSFLRMFYSLWSHLLCSACKNRQSIVTLNQGKLVSMVQCRKSKFKFDLSSNQAKFNRVGQNRKNRKLRICSEMFSCQFSRLKSLSIDILFFALKNKMIKDTEFLLAPETWGGLFTVGREFITTWCAYHIVMYDIDSITEPFSFTIVETW